MRAQLALLVLLVAVPAAGASAQTTSGPEPTVSAAHRTEVDALAAHATVAALGTRYGERHPEMLAARARLGTFDATLRALVASHAADAEVLAWIRWQLADIDARLAELHVTCTTMHVDVQTAERRRAVFASWLAFLTGDAPAPRWD